MTENKPKRPRGSGMIWKPPNSRFLWIKYYRDGECFRESTHGTSRGRAEKLLRTRLAEIDAGTFGGPQVRRVNVLVLYEDFLRDFQVSGKRAVKWAERCWDKHLDASFANLKARQVSTDTLNAYVQKRQQEGASNSTINRELACLRRAFNLALHATPRKVPFVPTFPHLQENAPRTGFVEDAQYAKLTAQNPPFWMRTLLAVAYSFGFRKAELLTMRVSQVDLLHHTIRLNPGTTKTREGRLISFEGDKEIETLLRTCTSGKQGDDFLFTRQNGMKVCTFRETWYSLCVNAGLGQLLCPRCTKPVDSDHHCPACGKVWGMNRLRYTGLIFHDLRRSAVRNMIRDGVPERVAMAISGHKTRSVFDRYNIVSETDLQQAARKIGAHRAGYAHLGQSTGIAEGKSKPASNQVV